MRSAAEIIHRLRQEATNAVLLLVPPSFTGDPGSLPLPDGKAIAAELRDTNFARDVVRIADEIKLHRFPLLGLTVDTGPRIDWRRDYVNAKETGTDYFRVVPYLDATKAGDHKNIWELNRHQHLVLLAQAYLLGGGDSNLAEIFTQLESWEDANPFQRGINWASALEVAFRAMSWLWINHFVGQEMQPGLRSRFLESLYRHARHIDNNLSFYFSPNTHLLGEAVALHALGGLFPEFRDLGAHVVAEQMDKQVREDGSHFEQSTYYHVYALDMFVFHAVLENVSSTYRAKLERMADYLYAVLGPQHKLPFIGDDDGGRFFHPYGVREEVGLSTLATCSIILNRPEWLRSMDDVNEQALWWLGPQVLASEPASPPPRASQIFADAGIAVMTAEDRHIVIDAGPFGPWGSGHSHSDTLSIVMRAGEQEILIDAGTYTYVGDEKWRNWFRGSAAHNTVRIDGVDQAIPVGPFRWTDQPTTRILRWESTDIQDYVEAECAYRGFTHRRRVRFLKPDVLLVTDEINGPPGEHEIEQFWHAGSFEAERFLSLDGKPERLDGWRSNVFAEKHPSPMLRIYKKCELPVKFETKINLK